MPEKNCECCECCVYYVVGFDPAYVVLAEHSAASVRAHNPGVDVVVFSQFSGTLAACASGVEASAQKLWVVERLAGYRKVVYMDADTLCLGPLPFDDIQSPGTLYTCAEHAGKYDLHASPLYTDDHPKSIPWYRDRRIDVFTGGMFGFVNGREMLDHFRIVREMPSKFYEQQAMNEYFNKRALTEAVPWPVAHAANAGWTPADKLAVLERLE